MLVPYNKICTKTRSFYVDILGTKRHLGGSCSVLQNYSAVILPIDVVVDRNVVAVVIVVRLLRPNLTVASSHHHVTIMQQHLTHSFLYMYDSHRLGVCVIYNM